MDSTMKKSLVYNSSLEANISEMVEATGEPFYNGLLYDLMLSAVEFYNENKPLKKTVTTVLVNKSNPADKIEDTLAAKAAAFDAAIKAGTLPEYEKVTTVINPKEELKNFIFGGARDKVIIDRFLEVLRVVTSPATVISADKEEGTKADKLDYNKKYAALKQAIKAAKDKGKTDKETEKIKELCQLLIDSKRTPKSTFSYMEVYNELKQKS